MGRSATRLRSLARLLVIGFIGSHALGGAQAQEAPVELPPPTAEAPQYALPPPMAEAPPYELPPPTALPPSYALPPRPLSTVDPVELEERGHRKKVIGAVLMGVGAGLSVIGLGFAVEGGLHAHCSGHEEHATCTPSAATSELQLGSLGLAAGTVMSLVGIPVYVAGGAQVAKARRLAALTVQPLVSSAGGGAIARVAVRF
jgi:hypothetical protein